MKKIQEINDYFIKNKSIVYVSPVRIYNGTESYVIYLKGDKEIRISRDQDEDIKLFINSREHFILVWEDSLEENNSYKFK